MRLPITRRGTRPASRSSPAGRSSGSARSASRGTPGPHWWTPAGYTRPRTPDRSPPASCAPCSAGCPTVHTPLSRVPLLVFDAGYDSAQLTLDLADTGAAILVRLRSDRCVYADPLPRPPAASGRPRRHGTKLACVDPATWPTPTATLTCTDGQYGTVTVAAWAGLHPKQQRHPAHGTRARGRSCTARSSACRSSASHQDPTAEGAVALVGQPRPGGRRSGLAGLRSLV
jgi:hypothetical protein